MEKKSEWLLDHANNEFSQNGEDGVIQKILDLIPDKNNWCVEFGAWDGIYLSNVKSLIEQRDYSAVLIEGSKKRYEVLKNNYVDYKDVYPINSYVGFSSADCLDVVLSEIEIPCDFDFLSIDVDGNDYHIWDAINQYSPKVICIEFNPTIPTEVEFVQIADPSVNQGSSLLSLVKLGKAKGYELVSVLPWNVIFVKSMYFPLLDINDNNPSTLRKNLEFITYIFTGYDGKVILQGSKSLCWHDINYQDDNLQILPKYLRKAPFNYGYIEKLFLRMLKIIKFRKSK